LSGLATAIILKIAAAAAAAAPKDQNSDDDNNPEAAIVLGTDISAATHKKYLLKMISSQCMAGVGEVCGRREILSAKEKALAFFSPPG